MLPVRHLALLAALAGCTSGTKIPGSPDGGLGPATCEPRSGDRLRLMRIEADGVSEIVGVFDAELMTECAIARIDEGGLRCLPTPVGRGQVFFTDAGCTSRVVLLSSPTEGPVPAYLQQDLVIDPCTTRPTFSALTGEMPLTAGAPLFTGSPASCTPAAAVDATYHTLGEQLGPDRLVGVREVAHSGDRRLQAYSHEGDDGSSVCGERLRDRDLEVDCAIGHGEDGALRCLPIGPPAEPGFRDVGCAEPLDLIRRDASCGRTPPPYAVVARPATCGERRAVFAGGAALDTVYTGGPGSCSVLALGDDVSAVEVGPTISSFSFAELTLEYGALGGRLERRDLVTSDGLRRADTAFRDRERMVDCRFGAAVDGSLRCLPTADGAAPLPFAETFFTDELCSDAIEAAEIGPGCAAPPSHALAARQGGTAVFALGPVHDGPLYRDVDGCSEVDAVVHDLGDELTPAELVEGERRTE